MGIVRIFFSTSKFEAHPGGFSSQSGLPLIVGFSLFAREVGKSRQTGLV